MGYDSLHRFLGRGINWLIWNQLPFLLYHSVFTQTIPKKNRDLFFLVPSPTSLGFFYVDRVFDLIVHNFYLCFCSSLISLHSLRHISSQSICGTKPKRPILPTSATGGQVSPRCDGVATLSHWCFSPCCLSDLDSERGSRGFWERNWSFHFPKYFLIYLLFLASLNRVSLIGSRPFPPLLYLYIDDIHE